MSDEAYKAYKEKCKKLGLKPTTREVLQQNEEVPEEHKHISINDARMISVAKAKEFVKKAYKMGYDEAMMEIAS